MKKYQFLVKPVFFIFNLLFATWLVFRIEEIRPSDFGMKDESKNKIPAAVYADKKTIPGSSKGFLKKICADYKCGILDSTELDQKLDTFFLRFP